MRVTLLTVGSRGDVQPMVALGAGLQAAGHRVRVATHPGYESLVTHHGLAFAPLAEGDVSKGAETEEGRRWIRSGSRRLPAAVGFLRDARSVARQRLADADRACADAEAVVAANLAWVLGWQLARLRRVPLVRVYLAPPAWMMTARRPARRIAPVVRQAGWLAARPWLNGVRRDALGAGPLPRREPLADSDARGEAALFAFSPAVLPVPGGLPPAYEATGFWFLDGTDDPEPPPGLEAFLADGSPPVSIGFGTMIDADPAQTVAVVADALRRAGQRGVLIGGARHGDVPLPPHLFRVGTIDHAWLFGRCAAAVHHAAVGTTAAAVRAGIPSVALPHMADQFLWARRLHALGAAPEPIKRDELTTERLADAIRRAATDETVRRNAAALGELVRAEDGVGRAVAAFERHLGAGHHPVLDPAPSPI